MLRSLGDGRPLKAEASKSLIEEALGDAFRFHITKLFGVLMVEPTSESMGRFMVGFRNAVDAHDELMEQLCKGE